jgi:hydroxyacylglutathione hydrolase
MRALNQAGPRPIGAVPDPRPLTLEHVQELLGGEHLLVDLRPAAEHAAAHVPGSVSIPASDTFGTWLGWVVDFDRPLVLLLDRSEDWDGAIRQALRVGYDRVAGHLRGGFATWQDDGGPVEASGRVGIAQLHDMLSRTGDGNAEAPLVIDVRQADEFAVAHVPGTVQLMCGDLRDRLAELPRERPILTICASGFRSSIAASLLRRAGFEHVSWVSGGVPAWRAAGFRVERGPTPGS